MKRVDEVYPLDINSTIGPTGTIKRLFRNHDYFIKRGYEMTILANVPVRKKLLTYVYELRELKALPEDNDSGIMADTINSSSIRSQIKSKLKKLIETNRFTSSYMYNRKVKGSMGSMVNYLKMNRAPDIVVFHEGRGCYNYLKLRQDNTVKTALFIHGDGEDNSMFLKKRPKLAGTRTFKQQMERLQYIIQNVDKVVFISDLARKRFCSAHPDCANKAFTILNGIDDVKPVNTQPSTEHHFRLVSTGSVCERKGQYIVIEAMHKMDPDLLRETHFSIIGTGPDHAALLEKVKEYGLEKHVSFLGNIPNKKVHELLCKENIYILMSNNEGLPISIIEAMRAGLPVISTKVAGIPEEVDERNGILIDPNVNQLTEIFNNLNKYDWNDLGHASRKRFEEEFTFEIMRKRYADLFDDLSSI